MDGRRLHVHEHTNKNLAPCYGPSKLVNKERAEKLTQIRSSLKPTVELFNNRGSSNTNLGINSINQYHSYFNLVKLQFELSILFLSVILPLVQPSRLPKPWVTQLVHYQINSKLLIPLFHPNMDYSIHYHHSINSWFLILQFYKCQRKQHN